MTKHDFAKNPQEIENYYFFRDGLTDEEITKILQIADKKKEISGVPFFEIGTDFVSGAQSSASLESVIKSNLS